MMSLALHLAVSFPFPSSFWLKGSSSIYEEISLTVFNYSARALEISSHLMTLQISLSNY